MEHSRDKFTRPDADAPPTRQRVEEAPVPYLVRPPFGCTHGPEHQPLLPYEAATAAPDDAMFASAPAPYLLLDRNGVITTANEAAAAVLSRTPHMLAGTALCDHIAPDDAVEFEELLNRAYSSGSGSATLRLLDAEERIVRVHAAANADPGSETCRLIAMPLEPARDAAAEDGSEAQFRAVADAAPALIWTANRDGEYVWFNRMWLDFTGRSVEEERGRGWLAGVHPDDLPTVTQTQDHAFGNARPFSLEYRLRDRSGSYRYVLVNGAPRFDAHGRLAGFVGTCTDISERRLNEEALRHSRQMLRHLVSYQERVREDERKRIAREIHDDLGQNLLALRLDVAMLHERTGSRHPLLNSKLAGALEHIDATMRAVRAAINNLRPTALDLGLNAAIEWQVQDFRRRSGIECDLLLDEDVNVDDNRATALFRILQESLNNVLRHAQATHVAVSLYQREGRLVMSIEDNGVGLYPDCRRKANSFGLIGIEERIHALGGDLRIESNGGTTLTISIPMN